MHPALILRLRPFAATEMFWRIVINSLLSIKFSGLMITFNLPFLQIWYGWTSVRLKPNTALDVSRPSGTIIPGNFNQHRQRIYNPMPAEIRLPDPGYYGRASGIQSQRWSIISSHFFTDIPWLSRHLNKTSRPPLPIGMLG